MGDPSGKGADGFHFLGSLKPDLEFLFFHVGKPFSGNILHGPDARSFIIIVDDVYIHIDIDTGFAIFVKHSEFIFLLHVFSGHSPPVTFRHDVPIFRCHELLNIHPDDFRQWVPGHPGQGIIYKQKFIVLINKDTVLNILNEDSVFFFTPHEIRRHLFSFIDFLMNTSDHLVGHFL